MEFVAADAIYGLAAQEVTEKTNRVSAELSGSFDWNPREVQWCCSEYCLLDTYYLIDNGLIQKPETPGLHSLEEHSPASASAR